MGTNKKLHRLLPRKLTWNLKNHPFEKENHLTNPPFLGSMFVFGGVTNQKAQAQHEENPEKILSTLQDIRMELRGRAVVLMGDLKAVLGEQ